MKTFYILLALVLGVLASVGLASLASARYPEFLVAKTGELWYRNVNIPQTKVAEGDKINLSYSVYNNSLKEKDVTTGFYLLKKGKVYDGTRLDYVSRTQKKSIRGESGADFNWTVPLPIDAGEYRMLIWLHKIQDGAEVVVQDYWYPEMIKITSTLEKNYIEGDEIDPGTDFYVSGLMVSPKKISSGGQVEFKYLIKGNLPSETNLLSGVYLINDNKKYDGSNIDFYTLPRGAIVNKNTSSSLLFKEKIDLPAGKYKILVWIHKLENGKEIFIEDYFAPGELEIL